ncbi:MAG: BspA family leucine-rich repeat surface protein [Flavobacteriaceae bacterium]|nr:BspA family leucine-rich repeat surface protein [Flavobacteriaceae bacterium]
MKRMLVMTILALTCFTTINCKKDKIHLSYKAYIESFSFMGQEIDISNTITITVDYNTNLYDEFSTIEISKGASISPEPSETTFTNGVPQIFTVTAINGDENKYTVIINITKNTESAITNFNITEKDYSPVDAIGEANPTITIELDINETIGDSIITISPDATASEGTVADNGTITAIIFKDGITKTIVIIAQDGITTTSYDITVSVKKRTESAITNFNINEKDYSPVDAIGEANPTITIELDINETIGGTIITISPDATATLDGNTLTVADNGTITGIIFKDGITKTIVIIAQDGETKTSYDITVSVKKRTESAITNFNINEKDYSPVDGIGDANSTITIELDTNKTIGGAIITISPDATISEGILVGNTVSDISFVYGEMKTITITAQDGITTTSYDITVNQYVPFISEWTVNAGDTVVLPLYDGDSWDETQYNFTVNWGDLSDEQAITTSTATHKYTGAGTYTITLTGVIKGFNFIKKSDSKDMITDITQWGSLKIGNYRYYFAYCNSLNISAIDSPDLSETTTLGLMFYHAKNFNSDIGHWNTSTIKAMSNMFQGTDNFNQDLSDWDVSNVISMTRMFDRAKAFNNGDVALDWLDTSKVRSMDYMFQSSPFNQNINNWKVGAVTSMTSMFQSAHEFNQDISGWDVSKVKLMDKMFNGAITFDQPIGAWIVSSVEDMSNMFLSAQSFNQDISSWDVSGVTKMDRMFYGTIKFNKPIGSWTVDSVENMQEMFYSAQAFNQDISDWKIGNVTNMNAMFKKAKAFNNGGVALNWQGAINADMSSMFEEATVFNQDISSWCVSSTDSKPVDFDTNSAIALTPAYLPKWGVACTP